MVHPWKRDTEITKEYVAQIHATQHIEMRAIERGYLEKVFVDEGQKVEKGDRMFRIMPMIYRADVKKAAAEAKFAEIEFKNTEVLQQGNIVSPNELAMARAKLDKADAEVSLAKAHLGLTEISAPFAGIMNRLHVRQGSLLDEGELLTTLSDNSKMWVYFYVTEAEYLDYKMQLAEDAAPKNVRLMMANHKEFPNEGVIETIEGEFNHETGNIAFRATFPNPKGLLRHGETGKVLMSTTLPDALLIPQKSTFEILDKRYVYVVDEKNTIRQRAIEVAEEIPHLYVISSGLTDKDRVLVEGLRKVRDGDVITARLEDAKKVESSLAVPAE